MIEKYNRFLPRKSEVAEQPLHHAADTCNVTARSGILLSKQFHFLHPWRTTSIQYHPN